MFSMTGENHGRGLTPAMDSKLTRRLERTSGHGRATQLCASLGDDGPYRAYKRLDDGTWVDLGLCGHDHPKVDWSCCCGKKDCRL